MEAGLPRMNLNQRVQHGLLLLLVGVSAGTGYLLGLPRGLGAAAAGGWHLASGLALLTLLVYHLLSLAIRGYVEGRRWAGFPVRLTRGDLAAAAAELRFVLGRATERPEAGGYRPSQKALYWWTLSAVALLGATGLCVGFWIRLGTLSLLPQLIALHRGLALVLLASLLWHLYGVLTWEGRWWPEWSWVNGVLDARKAELKLPWAWAQHLSLLEEAGASVSVSPEQRERARLVREKTEVQAELEKGNRCALEERYVEALFHYRRALELYPGYAQAQYNMARVLARMGEREMALETYRQFLEAEPFHPLAQKAQESIRELEKEMQRP
jgi:tetratricopeptide (TPR) repeat protein